MTRPVKMGRLPDGVAAVVGPPRRKPPRTRVEMRADLCRALEQAKTPLERRMKMRALAQMDLEQAETGQVELGKGVAEHG